MDRRTMEHAVVGAIVSFVFVPHSGLPLIGGALAGYLEGADLRLGSLVGVLAGLLALGAVLATTVGDTLLGAAGLGLTVILWEGLYHPARQLAVPLVVLPLIGGAIGAYVRRETDE